MLKVDQNVILISVFLSMLEAEAIRENVYDGLTSTLSPGF